MPKNEIVRMIRDIDQNEDLKISYPEFLKIMKSDLHSNIVSPAKQGSFSIPKMVKVEPSLSIQLNHLRADNPSDTTKPVVSSKSINDEQ